jgi:hypothetical protein
VAVMICGMAGVFGACDEGARPERNAEGRCSLPKEPTYPPGFTHRGIDRFFERALRVAGDRISHEAQGCVEEGRLVAELGMTDPTMTDRRRIEALAPAWLKVDLFATPYSMEELESFGDRAMTTLEDWGLDVFGLGFYGTRGKVTVYVSPGWVIKARQLLSAAIPPDSFVVEEGALVTF